MSILVVDLILECRGGSGPYELSDIKAIAHITGGGLFKSSACCDAWVGMMNPTPSSRVRVACQRGSVDLTRCNRTFSHGAWERLLLQCPRDVFQFHGMDFREVAWSQYRFSY